MKIIVDNYRLMPVTMIKMLKTLIRELELILAFFIFKFVTLNIVASKINGYYVKREIAVIHMWY